MKRDVNGFPVLYSDCGSKPIPAEKKVSLKRYMKICWENSRTNLHYIDFCARYGATMRAMFRPIMIRDDGPVKIFPTRDF